MAFIQLKCPNCNGKIEPKGERLFKCPFCETELLLQENNVYHVDQSVHHYHGTAVPTRPARSKPKRNGLLAGLLVLALSVYFIWIFANQGSGGGVSQSHVVRTEPESEVLQLFLRDIFDKTEAMPSLEELGSIRFLSVDKADDRWRFRYSFDDPFTNEQPEWKEYVVTDKVLNTQRMEQKDFEAFSGLTGLDLNGEYEITQTRDMSFSHMKNLKSYSSGFNESFHVFASYFGDKSRIQQLTTQIRSNEEMAQLLEFSNLQNLSITYVDESVTDFQILQQLPLRSLAITTIDDLGWLSTLPSLESLSIGTSEATDFSSLYALSQMEELTFDNVRNLRTLDFVASMPKLHTLDVNQASIVSLEPLRNKASLTRLRLADAGAQETLQVINSLSSLSSLTVSGYYSTAPELNLPRVTELALPSSFVPLLHAPVVSHLTVNLNSNGISGGDVIRFPQLEELSLLESGSFTQVKALNRLPKLHILNASETSFYGETRELFQLSNLTSLECLECTFQLEGEAPYDNGKLEQLNLNKSYFSLDNNHVDDLERITPYLTGLTEIRSFTLQDSSIQTLDFVKRWKQLEILHVENNAISNLNPLSTLTSLRKVYIAGNPVQNKTVLGDRIAVY
ncbi:putative C2H2 Zn-finger protein [Paenibacillus amylolyticus]|uniref:C2H2 Zn-finger protein n=1 Tax=Paenibacillus amylolyticus TaxID=1451 RepID=A0AAP5H6A2_PAEAM|nr:leucine-rich repeat domain-containing protein [Paenibacillus amylolyticus]MDR6725995.1 putative C2H2 Zn-finger protein [Paenibacillus amylolyticus]